MATAPNPLELIRRDPVRWVEVTFGEEVVGKQRDILQALAIPGIEEVHVRSCHASGKTHTCARAVAWFLQCWPKDSIVVTTAPTWGQVENLLWREIRDGAGKAKVDLGGRLLTTQWEFAPKWYAIGIATAPGTAVNIQGFHAAHVLVVVDEADGVSQEIWDAIDGLTTSAHVVVLAIGNPINPKSPWKKRHDLARTSIHARCIRIDADAVLPYSDTGKHPYLLQRKWVEDKKTRWGENHSLYIAKVLADWPNESSDVVIPIVLLERARGRAVTRGPRGLGVDVARYGTNRTVRTLVEGNQLIWSKASSQENTMQTAGRVFKDIEDFGPVGVAVDDTGVGGAVVDRLREMGKTVQAVNNGGVALDDTHFDNRGSELWWNLRLAFEGDYIGFPTDDPEGIDELVAELNRARYEVTDRGQRIHVDKYGLERGRRVRALSEEERAARSPDRADSFVLAWNSVAKRLPNAPVRQESEIERALREDREQRELSNGQGGWFD